MSFRISQSKPLFVSTQANLLVGNNIDIPGYYQQNGVPINNQFYPGLTTSTFGAKAVSRWTLRNGASSNNWRSVCWSPEKGLFVAVAESGTGNRVMTSPDGINWTSRTSTSDLGWTSVCWAAEAPNGLGGTGLFVAVAQTGTSTEKVMTSPDGIVWTARTTPDNQWHSVCWSKELSLFVAVSNTGEVMTSSDGVIWTLRTAAVNSDWRAVCWAPELGLFVAVASSGTGNRVMTSPNGIDWTGRVAAAELGWRNVTWSPELSLLVAVANSGTGNRVMTSSDGINWTSRSSAADNQWFGLCWSSVLRLFVAVAVTT